MANALSFVRSFNEISLKDVPLVGGKNASLGEGSESRKAPTAPERAHAIQ